MNKLRSKQIALDNTYDAITSGKKYCDFFPFSGNSEE